MNYTNISALRNQIRPTIPAAPIPTVDRAVRSAAILFCTQSKAIRERLTAISITSGTGVYALTAPTNTKIIDILEARYSGGPMDITSESELNIDVPGWDTVQGIPTQAYHSGYNEVTVAPLPSASVSSALKLTVAVAPLSTTELIPEELAEMYFDALVDGTLANLFAMPSATWASPPDAVMHKERMMQAANSAKLFMDERALRRRNSAAYIRGSSTVEET